MKLRNFFFPFLLVAILVSSAHALGEGDGVGRSSIFKKTTATAWEFVQSTWGLGQSASRLAFGYFTDLYADNLNVTTIVASTVVDGNVTIDITDPEAFLVRKDGDTGDVFIVDTTNSEVELPANTLVFGNGATVVNTDANTLTLTEQDFSFAGDVDITGEDLQATTGTINISKSGSMTTIKGTLNVDEEITLDVLLGQAYGGTGIDTSAVTNGQLLIGNTTGNLFALAGITGTANQITVTDGASSITLSTPQDIQSGATPTFTATNFTGLPAASVLAGTFGTGSYVIDTQLTVGTLTDGTASLNSGSLTSVKLGTLTSNGFVKTSGSDGTLSVDTTVYVTESTTVGDTNTVDLTLSTFDITADVLYQNSTTVDLSDDVSGLKADLNTTLKSNYDAGFAHVSNDGSDHSFINQSVTSVSTPTFVGADLDGATTINDTGADVDFRVEGVGLDDALFVQGSNGYVGIGNDAPDAPAHIVIDNAETDIRSTLHIEQRGAGNAGISIEQDGAVIYYISEHAATNELVFSRNAVPGAGGDAMKIKTDKDIEIIENIMIGKNTIFTPSATVDITAAGGLTVTNTNMRIQGDSGEIDITADPQIADGEDGQMVIIQGDNDTNTVTFDDGTGLALEGGISTTMGKGDILQLIYDLGDDLWYEVSRSNN